MLLYDFEYDGIKLSDKGYMICSGSGGIETSINGSKINFITVPIMHGIKNEFITSNYTECVTATFSICKKPCDNGDIFINLKEFNDMAAWLNRRKFCMFKVYDESYGEDILFNASFNLTKQEVNGKIYSIQLEMITDRPHAFLNKRILGGRILEVGEPLEIIDISNEEGYIYPRVTLIPLMNTMSNITIANNLDMGNNSVIKNCVKNEVIVMDYPMISSGDQTNSSHSNLFNDFNWNFLRIVNIYNNKTNSITCSKRCNLTISYYPIVKIGM